MARGTKRVAAIVAQAKIKTITAQDDENRRLDCHTKAKRRSSSVFDFDGAVAVDARHRSTLRLKTKGDHHQQELKTRGKGIHDNDATRSFEEIRPKQLTTTESSANGLDELLSSSSSSHSSRSRRGHEFMTAEKDYADHQRRRSIRSLNSTGPMILSYRTSYRISMSRFSPECSPIVSTRLRFTPVAHIPTTPTHATKATVTLRAAK